MLVKIEMTQSGITLCYCLVTVLHRKTDIQIVLGKTTILFTKFQSKSLKCYGSLFIQ